MTAATSISSEAPVRPGRGGPTDPSHDERLRRGIIHTQVSRPVAALIVGVFLAAIYGIPVSQAILEKKEGGDVQLADLFKHAPTKQSLHQFEDDLEQASFPKSWTQPRVQELLTKYGRVGNKKAVVGAGQGGWLYYKPGITYLGGPGFLDPEIMRARVRASEDAGDPPVSPDPRVAIRDFAAALARRGIKLMIFPMPDKAMLQPRELHGRGPALADSPVPRNPSYEQFVLDVRGMGVDIFDPSPARLNERDPPRFLVQDTHWTPEWMETAAGQLARFVRDVATLPEPPTPPAWKRVAMPITRVGDIVDMLKLTDGQTVFTPQTVTVHQVQDEKGAEWEPDPKGDVLLLGDSFTNVFSMDPMGWGSAAGLGPQLAYALGRGVDVIAQNDSGAFATRQALARELGGAEDRLAGKRIVIWEFASRELAVGDWKPVDWAAAMGQGAPK
jgi:alginate O-acetyltransferase complex protein AlgJ